MRDETEWVELVERGVNYLSGANAESILSAVGRMRPVTVMDDDQLYGGGQAARRIAQYFV